MKIPLPIQNRHSSLGDYNLNFKNNNKLIKGNKEYKKKTRKDPNKERKQIRP